MTAAVHDLGHAKNVFVGCSRCNISVHEKCRPLHGPKTLSVLRGWDGVDVKLTGFGRQRETAPPKRYNVMRYVFRV